MRRRNRRAGAVPATDVWIPRGYLTYSGLVVKNEDSKITLKTRSGPRTLRLRPDTRYSEASQPLLNKHVFVRAGRNLEGDARSLSGDVGRNPGP